MRLSAGGPACCVRRFSMPARASSTALAARRARARRSSSDFRNATAACATTRSRVLADGRVDGGLPQAAAPELHGVRRGALLRAGQRPVRRRRRRHGGRAHHLRGRLVRGTGEAGAGGGRAGDRRRPTVRPITRDNRRRGASRSAPGRAKPGFPSSTPTASEGRTSSCSTARRSSWTRRGEVVQQLPGWHETVALVTLEDGAPAPGARHARSAARVPRLRGAGDGRARLRDEEPVPGRAARSFRRRGFRAGARGGGRRAGTRPRARGDDAFALHALDQPRGCAGDGGDPPRRVQRDRDRADVRRVPRGACRRVQGLAARCRRGEHPGANSRDAADGAVQQAGLDRADDRQQVRDGGRLRDALWRHGGRLRRAEGHQQDAGLPACALIATRLAA